MRVGIINLDTGETTAPIDSGCADAIANLPGPPEDWLWIGASKTEAALIRKAYPDLVISDNLAVFPTKVAGQSRLFWFDGVTPLIQFLPPVPERLDPQERFPCGSLGRGEPATRNPFDVTCPGCIESATSGRMDMAEELRRANTLAVEAARELSRGDVGYDVYLRAAILANDLLVDAVCDLIRRVDRLDALYRRELPDVLQTAGKMDWKPPKKKRTHRSSRTCGADAIQVSLVIEEIDCIQCLRDGWKQKIEDCSKETAQAKSNRRMAMRLYRALRDVIRIHDVPATQLELDVFKSYEEWLKEDH